MVSEVLSYNYGNRGYSNDYCYQDNCRLRYSVINNIRQLSITETFATNIAKFVFFIEIEIT